MDHKREIKKTREKAFLTQEEFGKLAEILIISLDDHPYRETFVSLNVSGVDVNEDQVHLMIRDNVNVTI